MLKRPYKLLSPIQHWEMKIRDEANLKYPTRLTLTLPTESVPQFNFRCQMVAAQAAQTNHRGAVAVIETVIIYTNGITGHYVNLMEDGTICDFTMGIGSIDQDVRFIRYVHPNEYYKMNDVLWNLKLKLSASIPAFYKPFYDLNKLC